MELIFALEKISYRFNMKPNEFWNCTVREIVNYIDSQFNQLLEQYKMQINLLEILSDKILYNNPYIVKSPKNIRIQENFKQLYDEVIEEKEQTIEEQIRVLRNMKEGN